jgi:uncharacterized membrane protein YcaP (DUF421 family)
LETLGSTAFSVVATMLIFLIVWLIMGKRQLGEFTPFDFIVSITAGTIAGAGIADPRIEIGRTISALLMIGALQVMLSWLSLKFRAIHDKLNHEPTILVEDGQIIKGNLRKLRLSVEVLLQLLREKDVFDITEVELAILEPHGKLSVLKKAEFSPMTPSKANITVPPNKILLPVILEGELQEDQLRKMGFSNSQIDQFRNEYGDRLGTVFVAFMDKNQQVHVVEEDVQEKGLFLH